MTRPRLQPERPADVEITADLARAEASIVAAGSTAAKPLFRPLDALLGRGVTPGVAGPGPCRVLPSSMT